MVTNLFATNLRVPPAPVRAITRDHLIAALEQGIPTARLVVVSAPAGYGKTTLLSQWARSSQFPVAWISLGTEHDDRNQFFRAMLLAWEAVQPGMRESTPGLLLGDQEPDFDAVLAGIISLAGEIAGHLVIVFDDAQVIHDASIHQALIDLLDHMPSDLSPGDGVSRRASRLHRSLSRAPATAGNGFRRPQVPGGETADFLNGVMDLDLERAISQPCTSRWKGGRRVCNWWR